MPPFAWAVDWDIIYCHDASWKDDAEWTLTNKRIIRLRDAKKASRTD